MILEGTIFSKVLNCDTHIGVILPHDCRPHVGINGKLKDGLTPREKPKTLLLLHGMTDCDSTWWRRTSLERYAELNDVCVIMPDAAKSFYADMVYGGKYFTYITQELPELVAQTFNVSVTPEDLYVAGLSMGGYGALKSYFTYPEKFAGCGAFSSGTSLSTIGNTKGLPESLAQDMQTVMKAAFGDPVVIPDNCQISWLFDHLGDKVKDMRLLMTCGMEDFTYAGNVALKEQIEANGNMKEFVWDAWHGIHEWGFWDISIQKFFDMFIK